MKTFVIRKAENADRTEVHAFVLAEMRRLYRPGSFYEQPDDLLRFEDVYIKPKDCCFFVARSEDGMLIGTAGIKPYNGRFDELVPHLIGKMSGEVMKVYVHSEWRGQGVGSALYQSWEAFAQQAGYRYGYLHTETHLPGGYPFWKSRGYLEQAWETAELVHMTKEL